MPTQQTPQTKLNGYVPNLHIKLNGLNCCRATNAGASLRDLAYVCLAPIGKQCVRTRRLVVDDDIVTQLSWYITNEVRMPAGLTCTVIDCIERLQQQVEHAHAILGSEAMIWLMGGSEHAGSWINALGPSVHSYWNEYGTVLQQAKKDQHGQH
jgi:hypothetical protein